MADERIFLGFDVGGTKIGIGIISENGKFIADDSRRRVKEELGLTVSVGVSFNKVFAKLGSDLKKPDGTTVIDIDNFKHKVWSLPVGDMLYVGKSMVSKLNKINIKTLSS